MDLIGATGTNGLRGEFRNYKLASEKNDTAIMKALDDMRRKQEANLKWTVGTIVSVAGIFVGVVLNL